MASLNQVNLIGRLGADPIYRIGGKSGAGFTSLSLATTRTWRDGDGQPQSRTDWHKVVLNGRLAEVARDYLAKGRSVYVRGHLQTRQYKKDDVEHFITEIIAEELQMLDKPPGSPPLTDEQEAFVSDMDAEGSN